MPWQCPFQESPPTCDACGQLAPQTEVHPVCGACMRLCAYNPPTQVPPLGCTVMSGSCVFYWLVDVTCLYCPKVGTPIYKMTGVFCPAVV